MHRIGRAMLKPLFAQKHSKDGHINAQLVVALLWWRRILTQAVSELKPWSEDSLPPCRLFVDAASTPPCCAAILFDAGSVSYTVWEPPTGLLEKLQSRRDNQICSLVHMRSHYSILCVHAHLVQEIIAILLALATFSDAVASRKVILYSDNVGAEKATSRGSAKAWDHNHLVHQIWSLAYRHSIRLWVERVPSKYNLADCPSRGSTKILELLSARFIAPHGIEPVLGDLELLRG